MKRRSFLEVLGGVLAAVAMLRPRALRAAPRQLAFRLDGVPQLATVGGSAIVTLKGHRVLVVRTAVAAVLAFNPVCTHKQCEVAYEARSTTFRCPCHGSVYDQAGKVLSGPASSPLGTYPAALVDGRVVVTIDE